MAACVASEASAAEAGGGGKRARVAEGAGARVRGAWSAEEDALLRRLVAEGGARQWGAVAARIRGRSSKSCRLRWCNHLHPRVSKAPFTREEDRMIVLSYAAIRSRWSVMAKAMPGRTDSSIKNHWYATLKRRYPELLAGYIAKGATIALPPVLQLSGSATSGGSRAATVGDETAASHDEDLLGAGDGSSPRQQGGWTNANLCIPFADSAIDALDAAKQSPKWSPSTSGQSDCTAEIDLKSVTVCGAEVCGVQKCSEAPQEKSFVESCPSPRKGGGLQPIEEGTLEAIVGREAFPQLQEGGLTSSDRSSNVSEFSALQLNTTYFQHQECDETGSVFADPHDLMGMADDADGNGSSLTDAASEVETLINSLLTSSSEPYYAKGHSQQVLEDFFLDPKLPQQSESSQKFDSCGPMSAVIAAHPPSPCNFSVLPDLILQDSMEEQSWDRTLHSNMVHLQGAMQERGCSFIPSPGSHGSCAGGDSFPLSQVFDSVDSNDWPFAMDHSSPAAGWQSTVPQQHPASAHHSICDVFAPPRNYAVENAVAAILSDSCKRATPPSPSFSKLSPVSHFLLSSISRDSGPSLFNPLGRQSAPSSHGLCQTHPSPSAFDSWEQQELI